MIINGTVLDYHFTKRKIDTVFKIGDIIMGQLFNVAGRWTAVSYYGNPYGPVKGFSTRCDAAEFLISVFQHNIKIEELHTD